MILNDINYKMAIYRDATLGEVLTVGACIFLLELIILGLLTKIIFGYAVVGVVIAIFSFFPLTKLSLNKLQKVKYGKPYGYPKHLFIKKMTEIGLCKSYLIRQGIWSVRRSR